MDMELGLLTGIVLADKKLRRALIEPSVTAIGQFANAWIDHLFAPLHPARRRNFLHHAAEAMERLGRQGLEDVAAEAAFVEWAEGVSMVEPQDEELAIVWQAALAEMRLGGHERLALLDIAKRMRPDEALAFDRLARARFKPGKGFPVPPAPLWDWLCDAFRSAEKRQARFDEQAYLARFVELGLAQSLAVRLRASGGLKLSATFALTLAGAWGLTYWFWASDTTAAAVVIKACVGGGAIVCGFVSALSLARKLVNPPELTPHGVTLARQILALRPSAAATTPPSAPTKRKRAKKAKRVA